MYRAGPDINKGPWERRNSHRGLTESDKSGYQFKIYRAAFKIDLYKMKKKTYQKHKYIRSTHS